jgi:hypothetical protein
MNEWIYFLSAQSISSSCNQSPPSLLLKHREAFLPKPEPRSLFCHQATNHFTLQVKVSPGQQLNLTMLSFMTSAPQCFGEVIEGCTGQRAELCSQPKRLSAVMMSNSEMVIIQLNVQTMASYMIFIQGAYISKYDSHICSICSFSSHWVP